MDELLTLLNAVPADPVAAKANIETTAILEYEKLMRGAVLFLAMMTIAASVISFRPVLTVVALITILLATFLPVNYFWVIIFVPPIVLSVFATYEIRKLNEFPSSNWPVSLVLMVAGIGKTVEISQLPDEFQYSLKDKMKLKDVHYAYQRYTQALLEKILMVNQLTKVEYKLLEKYLTKA